VLEVSRGEVSEGDGTVAYTELWRWHEHRLDRIFALGQGDNFDSAEFGTLRMHWAPAPPVSNGAPPALEVTWNETCCEEAPAQWGSEHHLRYKFDGSRFRPPAGALFLSADDWLPPSRVARYEPSMAVDGRNETAWCAAKNPGAAGPLRLHLLEPRRIRALRIVPGYAKSQTAFLDNARVARLHIRADADPSVDVDLDDRMEAQRILLPRQSGKVTVVDIWILGVRPGRSYQDVCISEIAVEFAD
jgi:hypothetical protein